MIAKEECTHQTDRLIKTGREREREREREIERERVKRERMRKSCIWA